MIKLQVTNKQYKEIEHKMTREVDGVGMGGYEPKDENPKT